MMDDIVKRIRQQSYFGLEPYEAANEIEQLRQRVAEFVEQSNLKDETIDRLQDELIALQGGDEIEQLRQRVAELEKERDSAYKIADHYRAERDECGANSGQWEQEYYKVCRERDGLKQQIAALVEAATMAVEMIEYNKHERRHVRWKLNDAIASIKEK